MLYFPNVLLRHCINYFIGSADFMLLPDDAAKVSKFFDL